MQRYGVPRLGTSSLRHFCDVFSFLLTDGAANLELVLDARLARLPVFPLQLAELLPELGDAYGRVLRQSRLQKGVKDESVLILEISLQT